MSVWHRIKVRLGLEDDWDDEYDEDYDNEYHTAEEPEERPRSGGFYGRSVYDSPSGSESTSVKRVNRDADSDWGREAAPLRSVPAGSQVSAMKPQLKMAIVEPKAFTEAQSIADKFKAGTPVIMNLTASKPELAKRLIDFASGLTYGLDGGLQKVSDKVFMLTPANVDVSAEDRRRLRDKGLFTME